MCILQIEVNTSNIKPGFMETDMIFTYVRLHFKKIIIHKIRLYSSNTFTHAAMTARPVGWSFFRPLAETNPNQDVLLQSHTRRSAFMSSKPVNPL